MNTYWLSFQHTILIILTLCLTTSIQLSAQLTTCSVNAGANGEWCFGDTLILDGNIAGLIQPGTMLWTQTGGAPVTVLDPTSLKAKIAPPAAGTYTFKISATCSQGMAEQTVTHTVLPGAMPDAGPDQIIQCYTGGGIPLTGFNLPPSGWEANWSADEGRINNGFFFPDTAINGICYPNIKFYSLNYTFTSEDGCIIRDNKYLRLDNILPDSFSIILKGGCGEAYIAKAVCPGAASGVWTLQSSSSSQNVQFTNSTSNVTQITGLQDNETYVIRYTISSPQCGVVYAEKQFVAHLGNAAVTSCIDKIYYYCSIPDSVRLEGCKPNIGNSERAYWRMLGYYEANYGASLVPTYNVANVHTVFSPDSTSVTISELEYGNLQLEYVITNGQCESVTLYSIQILGELSFHKEYNFSENCGTYIQDDVPYLGYCNIIQGSHNFFALNLPTLGIENSQWAGGQLFAVGPTSWEPIIYPLNGDTVHLNYVINNIDGYTCYGTTFYLPLNIPNGQYTFHGNYNFWAVDDAYFEVCGEPDFNINIEISNPPTPANAGTDQFICTTTTSLAGNTVSNPNWYFLSKSPASASDPILQNDSTKDLSLANLSADAEYRFVYRSWGGAYCESSYDTVLVRTASAPPSPPNAGADINACFGTEINLSATPNPAQTGTLGTWTMTGQTPPGAAPQLQNTNSPNTIVGNLFSGTTYTFRYTVQNGCGTAFDEVQVTTGDTEGPHPPDAGSDQCLSAGTTVATLVATSAAPSGAIGMWSTVPGNPAGAVIANLGNPNTTVSGLAAGTYSFVWSVTKAPCGTLTDTVVVTIGIGGIADIPQEEIEVCNQAIPATVALQAVPANAGAGIWSIVEGIPGAVIANPNSASTNVSNLLPGNYRFRWTVSNGACGSGSDEIIVRVGDVPPIVNAGSDTVLCADSGGLMQLNGTPPGSFPGYWSVVNAAPGIPSAGVSFVQGTATSQHDAVVQANPGRTRLRWTLLPSAPCSDAPSVDDILIDYIPPATLPEDTLKICHAPAFNLAGTSPGSAGIGTWTQSGGASVTGLPNVQASSNPIIVNLPGDGTYQFTYTITSNSCPTTTDVVTVVNYPLPPFPNIGADDTICVKDQILLMGSDIPAGYTATWSLRSGPNPPTRYSFSPNANSQNVLLIDNPSYSGNAIQPGVYIFDYTLSNGGCTVNDAVRDSVYLSTIDAGADKVICDETTTSLGAVSAGLSWSSVADNPSPALVDAVTGAVSGIVEGGDYFFKLSDADGCYDVVKVSKTQAILINQQPAGDTVCTGGQVTLASNVTALQGNLQYQWQSASSATGPFSNVSGATSSTYFPPVNMPGTSFFRLLLSTSANSCKDTTLVTPVRVVPDQSILTQPQNLAVCAGTPLQLSASATNGIAPLQYQWQSANVAGGPWTNIPGATNTNYNPPGNNGTNYYRLTVASPGAGCSTATSNSAQVTVDEPVSINAEPQNLIECIGGAGSLLVNASGGAGFTYQWQSATTAGGPFANVGSNQNSFAPSSTMPGTTYFRVHLASVNGICEDTSVVTVATIVSDQSTTTQPQAASLCPGEPVQLFAAATGGVAPLQYQWQSATTSGGPWTNVSGAISPTFTPPTGNSGTTFYQMTASSMGEGCSDAVTNPAEVEVFAPVAIAIQPQSLMECIGGNQSISVAVSGGVSQTFQWQFSPNGGLTWLNVPGGNGASLTPPSAQNDTTMYRVVVADNNAACGGDTSAVSVFVVNTVFVVTDSLEVCNADDGVGTTFVDFTNLILAGDPNSNWQSLDAPEPPGTWSNKDFSGWTAGNVYRFVATTTDAVTPCINVSDTVFVKISNCCPSTCTNLPTLPLCNEGAQSLDLNTLECPGTQPGAWYLTAGPGIVSPLLVSNDALDPSGLAAGTYTISYQLSQSPPAVCPAFSEQTVQVIQAPDAGVVSGSVVFCEKTDTSFFLETLITGEDMGGTWSELSGNPPSGGGFNVGSGSINGQLLAAGNYSFQYKLEGGVGCADDEATVVVQVLPTPAAFAGDDQLLTCDTPVVMIGSLLNPTGGSFDLQWQELSGAILPDETSPVIQVSEAGTYEISVTDIATGCFSTDFVVVAPGESFITDIEEEVIPPTCFGDQNGSITIANVAGGTPPYTFSLSGIALQNQTGIFTNLAAGAYLLEVEDANGCQTQASFNIDEPLPLSLSMSVEDTTIFYGDSITLQAISNLLPYQIAQLQWFEGSELLYADTNLIITITPLETNTYRIVLQDLNGCEVSAQLLIIVDKSVPVYVPTAFSPNGDGVNDLFKIYTNYKVTKVNYFRIFDRWGDMVYHAEQQYLDDPRFGWDGTFNGKEMNPAVFVYVAEVELFDGTVRVLEGGVTLVR